MLPEAASESCCEALAWCAMLPREDMAARVSMRESVLRAPRATGGGNKDWAALVAMIVEISMIETDDRAQLDLNCALVAMRTVRN